MRSRVLCEGWSIPTAFQLLFNCIPTAFQPAHRTILNVGTLARWSMLDSPSPPSPSISSRLSRVMEWLQQQETGAQ